MKKVKLRPHHLQSLYFAKKHNNYFKIFLRHIKKGYNPINSLLYALLAKKIVDNPNLEVEVVSSLDDVCKFCNKRKKYCFKPEQPFDFRIEPNKTYKADELFRIVGEYYRR